MPHPIITLTTDYGLTDHLVGTVKGAILKINPDANIIDINHSVIPYDILDGALSLAASYRHFPPKTIHVVVDPGVGTERRPLLVRAAQQYFVAPDNGVLSVVYEREEDVSVRHVTAEHYFSQPISNTFHGRDVFAPIAAWLSKTGQLEAFGEEIQDFVRFSLPKPKHDGNVLKGVILREDHFGNLLTNFAGEDLPPEAVTNGKLVLQVAGKEVRQLVQTFAQGPAGEAIAVIGSSGYVEIAANRANAARLLGAHRGAEVTLALS